MCTINHIGLIIFKPKSILTNRLNIKYTNTFKLLRNWSNSGLQTHWGSHESHKNYCFFERKFSVLKNSSYIVSVLESTSCVRRRNIILIFNHKLTN